MTISAVILAAGLGTRMKSAKPKVLHTICGKPMVNHVIDAVKTLKPEQIIVVVGPQNSAIQDALKNENVSFAVQKEPKGTADALKTAARKISAGKNGKAPTVLVLSGDAPLVRASTLQEFLKVHKGRKEAISILSSFVEGEHSYGRIVRNGNKVTAIVECKDATEEQKKIKEVNGGIYAIESAALGLLKDIKINPLKGEYYLTDLIGIAAGKGHKIGAHMLGDATELTGINTRSELCIAGLHLRDRTISRLLDKGVSFIDTKSVFIDPDAEIGNDTLIYPNVIIEGKCAIGSGCTIYPNTRIKNSTIGNNAIIKDMTLIEDSVVRDGAEIGPFARIRPGSDIGVSAKIGNYVEVKKSVIGDGAKAQHLSYLGDAEIGRDVNIGAGTITCNYDGINKNKTIIEEGSFIGSDTQLVAPVKVGKGAYVGAGSTITKDVPPQALALSRTPQKNIEGWALRRAPKKTSHKKNGPTSSGNSSQK